MSVQFEALADRIAQLLTEREPVIAAIDGPCGAGKTTLAAELALRFDCNVFHTDDFFLRPEQRTPQRLAEPGGNLDRERFLDEVLLPLQRGGAFRYRPYRCGQSGLVSAVEVEPKRLHIVEGSYSCHPAFGDCYDLRIFIPVSEDIQTQRILQRPEHLQRRFFSEWIPMEHRYFDTFRIPETCHILYEV